MRAIIATPMRQAIWPDAQSATNVSRYGCTWSAVS